MESERTYKPLTGRLPGDLGSIPNVPTITFPNTLGTERSPCLREGLLSHTQEWIFESGQWFCQIDSDMILS